MSPRLGWRRWLLLLLLLGGCRRDPCEELACVAPLRCDAVLLRCFDVCTSVRCPLGQVCDSGTGQCAAVVPRPPALGAVLDRVGRPLVNVALTNAFDLLKPAGAEAPEAGDLTRDRYNASGDSARWKEQWASSFPSQIGLYDALDGVCGNSLFADSLLPRYSAVAALLADDQLYLDSSAATCTGVYLAVEQKGFGVAVADCGGRALRADVVDATASQLVLGKAAGVTDGVDFSAGVGGVFPFLGDPPE